MELRDLVLSTLEELDSYLDESAALKHEKEVQKEEKRDDSASHSEEEIAFLKQTKERLEVLFMGLKSPEIKDGEAKLELTLKYLQLLLADVESRLKEIK
jgi:hypothetical protein